MSPTLTDIAKRTQTSVSTVSRVLAGGRVSQRISEATRNRILETAKQMGYRPNLMARGLRTRRSNTIALLVGDIANPWYGQFASLVEKSLHRSGYTMMLCNSGEDPQREAEYLELLPQKGIDGLILVPIVKTKKALYDHIPDNLPIVIADRPIPGMDSVVSSDEAQLSELLCNTLGRVLVRSIAVVTGPQHVVTHRRRYEAVAKCFTVVATHEGPSRADTGRQALIKFLSGSDSEGNETPVPDAIVCTNTLLGQGVIDAIAEIDNPPIIACFDELPMAHLSPIPIVCTIQDVPMLAESCVSQLLPQLKRDGNASETFKPTPIYLPARAATNRAFQKLQVVHSS